MLPTTVTLKAAVCPTTAVSLVGCTMMTGAEGTMLRVALLLVAMPARLVIVTL